MPLRSGERVHMQDASVQQKFISKNAVRNTLCQDAIAAKSYFVPKPSVLHSSVATASRDVTAKDYDWTTCDHIIEGSIGSGAQEHFYMETQACIVTPKEDDFYEVIGTTQFASGVQVRRFFKICD